MRKEAWNVGKPIWLFFSSFELFITSFCSWWVFIFSWLTFLFLYRRQREAELKLIEEETAKRVEEAIQKKVEESLSSAEIQLEVQRRLEEGRRRLHDEVAAQLEKEKEIGLIQARQKEVEFTGLVFCISPSLSLGSFED